MIPKTKEAEDFEKVSSIHVLTYLAELAAPDDRSWDHPYVDVVYVIRRSQTTPFAACRSRLLAA